MSEEEYTQPDDSSSALSRREGELYARENRDRLPNVRSRLHHGSHSDIPSDWGSGESMSKKRSFWRSPVSLALIAGIVFFVSALGFFLFSIVTNRTVVSPDNVEITVQGPVSIAAGEELALQVMIQNNNPVAIEVADLIVTYPVGARRADENRSVIVKDDRDFVGTLVPGQAISRTIRTVLFGNTDQEQEFGLTLEYRSQGSNAILETRKSYSLPLSAAPVSLALELPETLSADQDFEGLVRVRTNSKTTLENVRVSISYPPGFVFYDADPQPSSGQRTFDLGNLAPGTERTILFNGSLLGQDNELKTFTVTVGGAGGDSTTIGVPFNSTLSTITMVRPSLSGVLVINGSTGSDPAVLFSNQNVEGTLVITNNHSERVIDLSAAIRIAGEALDPSSVQASDGFFRSTDRIIIWDVGSDTFPTVIDPGESLQLPFTFRLVSPAMRVNLANARQITLDVSVQGRLATPDQQFAELSVTSERDIRISSDFAITGNIVHFIGPLQNTGLIPPQVNQPTTYTVLWAITNGTNDIRDARVIAKLPQYASFVGAVSPSGETVRFNSETNEAIWDAGIVRAGTGISRPVREVAFQIQVVPSAPQVGQVLTVIGDATLRGNDTFTNRILESTTRSLTTILTTDPDYQDGMQSVVP
ncbi:MAG: hypothetical protein Q8P93_01165 [bacterium]|nr:hypothetical protein [bacterium]